MLLNKENILAKTHYGLKIYAWVLRQYFPQNMLKCKGKTCELTHSPFNAGKKTLQIWLEDGCACHRDIEVPGCDGDVFDFANFHLRFATTAELYYQVNQVMHLRLKIPAEENASQFLNEDPEPVFSIFQAPIRNTIPAKEVTLPEVYRYIKGKALKQLTENYRKLSDPKERRKFKANHFHYVCFSGVFRKRSDDQLLQHSNLLCLDFDHLENLPKTRHLLLKDKLIKTCLLFTSPSGDGLKWIVKIDTDCATHRDYFNSISNYLKSTYNLTPDPSGKDISRACFLCHDPEAVLRES
ncbi:BT4734/BF3469 family protein [Salegentibacter sp. HM20]